LTRHQQEVAAIVQQLLAPRGPNNQLEADATEGDGAAADTYALSSGAVSFRQALQMLCASPNHRPPEQLNTILLWLLSSAGTPALDPADTAAADKKVICDVVKGFKKYTGLSRRAVADYTVAQTVRGNYPVPESVAGTKKGHTSQLTLVQALRCWNAPRLQRVDSPHAASGPEPCAAVDVLLSPAHALPMPASPASALGSPSRATATAVMSSLLTAPSGASSTPLAYKPVAGKPIAPLAQLPVQVSPRSGATITNTSAINSGRSTYKHVRCHEGMHAFLHAAKWQAPTLVTLDEVAPADVPRSSVMGVRAQLLDTYEALPAGEDGLESSLRHAQPWPAHIVVSGKSKSPNTVTLAGGGAVSGVSDTPPKLVLQNPNPGAADEQGGTGAPGGGGVRTPPRSPPALPASPSSPLQAARGEVVPMARELAFFMGAPELSAKQRLALLTSLASDVARTVVVSIFVLARHAWAGKRIRKEDVVAILGGPCAQALGSKLVDKLCCWLHANCRAVASFKLANESLLEAAILRIYAYWPLLAIQLRSEVDASDESQIKKVLQNGHAGGFPASTCVIALIWPDRIAAEGIFREPHTFQCNTNII